MLPPSLKNIVDAQSHPLLFATVSGAHLYGFASPDSDYDLRGVHILMRTGKIEANLPTLNEGHQLSHVRELITRKAAEREDAPLANDDMSFHEGEYARLRNELELAYQASTLPEEASAKPALHELLLRLRRGVGG
jgi:predicted nucleotidyltransferase